MSKCIELEHWIYQLTGQSPQFSLDNKFYRFKWESKSSDDGWIIGVEIDQNITKDPFIVCTVGSWVTGEKHIFKTKTFGISKKDKQKLNQKLIKHKKSMFKKIEEEKSEKNKNAKNKAISLLNSSKNCDVHPYLTKKKLDTKFGYNVPHSNLRIDNKKLIIPMVNKDNQIVGLQFIDENGNKKFLYGQKTKGAFHVINESKNYKKIYIGEGYATMATVSMVVDSPCVVAFNSNNLFEVCRIFYELYPYSHLIVIGDEDLKSKKKNGESFNPGREKAEEAINHFGGSVIFPSFKDKDINKSDFSDLYLSEGINEVSNQVNINLEYLSPQKLKINVSNKQVSEVAQEAWSAILLQNRPIPFLFNKDGNLVRFNDLEPTKIEILNKNSMYSILVNKMEWIKIVNSVPDLITEKSTIPQKNIYPEELLCNPDQNVPKLSCITEVPMFSKNGNLILEPGYHVDDCIFAVNSKLMTSYVSHSNISKYDVFAARDYILEEVMGDFIFVNEQDKVHAFALLLSPFLRELISGPTPLFAVEAISPNAGKSLLVSALSLISIGKKAHIQSFSTNNEELRKSIVSILSNSPRMVVFDNAQEGVKSKIDSATLAGILTASSISDRALGSNRIIKASNNATWVLTANTPQYSTEIYRRIVQIHLKNSKSERVFRHKFLLRWIEENKTEIVGKVLTILQAWKEAGCPKSEKRLDSFEEWSSVIGGVLEFIGFNSFFKNKKFLGYEVNHNRDLIKLLEIWGSDYPLEMKVSELNTLCEEHSLLGDLRGDGNKKSQETSLGIALSKKDGVLCGSYQLVISKANKSHGKVYKLRFLGP